MPLPLSRAAAQLNLFHKKELRHREELLPTDSAQVVNSLPPWLARFVREAVQETDTLRENGAEQAAAARVALLRKVVAAAQTYLDTELGAAEAALETGTCEETIRRAVRDGTIPDRRANPKGRHRVRRGDLQKLAAPSTGPYDPDTDAQDIARLRRKV